MQDSLAESTSGPNSGGEPSSNQSAAQLVIEAADSFNYAAWQNAVPLLRSIIIDNTNGTELSSLTVELTASPAFARGKRWTVDRVGAGEKLTLKEVDLDVDPAYLDNLDEAERGVLTFQLMHKGNALHETPHVLRVLARDEWGGMSTMGDLLPAFVTPNDPSTCSPSQIGCNAAWSTRTRNCPGWVSIRRPEPGVFTHRFTMVRGGGPVANDPCLHCNNRFR